MNLKGIKDAANFTLKRKEAGGVKKTVLYADYCNETSFDVKNEEVVARKKGVKSIIWNKGAEGTAKFSAEVYDLSWLGILLGSDWRSTVSNILTREVLTIASGKVSLKDTPKTGTLEVFTLEDDLTTNKKELTVGETTTAPDTYAIVDKDITFNTTSQPDGTKIAVFYIPSTMPTGKSFVVKTHNSPANYEIYGDTMVRDTNGIDSFLHFYVPNARPKSNFQLTMNVDNVAKLDMEFDLLEGLIDGEKGLLDLSVIE